MNLKPNIDGSFGPFSQRGFKKLTDKVNEKKQNDLSRYAPRVLNVFLAKITANTVIITGRRWKYAWEEAEQYTDTIQKFQTKGGSTITSATTTIGYAYNTIEALQQASGATSNGPGFLNANLPTGFTLQPIATGTYVLMHASINATDGSQAFSFCVSNAIDGTCP